jgi:FkbM family methyltransferase
MNYFIHLLGRLKSRGNCPKVLFDVGAHFGETNEMMRSAFPDSRIISFEANPNCIPILESRGIEFVPCLLGRENVESVKFYTNPDDPVSTGCSIFKENTVHFSNAKVIELPMYRLDYIVPPEIVPEFLKMDVQGAELSVLDGAEKLLPSIRWIYLEVSFVNCNDGAPMFKEVADHLYARGYSITDMCDSTYIDNQLVQSNFLFERK